MVTNVLGNIQPDPIFYYNAEETDNRLQWLQATKTLHDHMQMSALSSRELLYSC